MHADTKSPLLFAPPSPSLFEDCIRAYVEGVAPARPSPPTLAAWLDQRPARPEPAGFDLEIVLDAAFERGAQAEEAIWLDADELVELAA